jgi:hypothetical protein
VARLKFIGILAPQIDEIAGFMVPSAADFISQVPVEVGCFLEIHHVHRDYRHIGIHFLQHLNNAPRKIRFLFRAPAFHDVAKDVNEILLLVACRKMTVGLNPDFDVARLKQTGSVSRVVYMSSSTEEISTIRREQSMTKWGMGYGEI